MKAGFYATFSCMPEKVNYGMEAFLKLKVEAKTVPDDRRIKVQECPKVAPLQRRNENPMHSKPGRQKTQQKIFAVLQSTVQNAGNGVHQHTHAIRLCNKFCRTQFIQILDFSFV